MQVRIYRWCCGRQVAYVVWTLRRQVIGVRETWLHPGLPAQPAGAVFATVQPPSSAAVEDQVATGRNSEQATAEGLDHDSAKEADATLCGQAEREMHAATLAED